ncbi:aldehyde dehydrogenase family protein [Myxococcus sp. MISCRS1]|uniref:aldehyde dehydrogenase family protein n=1 Tax=Myxococcus sp. MISCRS1 TaxID=2996786 RepID=UPI00226FCEBE|nr:aldehyde dehydrogenase family protein [Myxococcus sp. MISCRS1]MCY1001735.1 aldehyde dehydrogenase family protein [Myxococcus sp. MISCRS1]
MIDARSLSPRLPVLQLLIDGQGVDPIEGGTFPVVNPATGEKVCDVPSATAADVDRAVKAARRAFESGPWSKMSARERGKLIRKLSDLLWQRREEFALVESLNNGKTFRDAIRGDVAPGAGTLAYFADWADKVHGEVLPVDGPFHTYVLKEPVGVAGLIVPWNYPTCILCWKLGPALAAGCTVVVKPSEMTPLTAMKLGALALEAGFPPGVLNVVPGYGDPAGEALARHPDVDKISFTGSGRTARRLMQASAGSNLKKLTLELGGKSPQVVFADADMDRAVEACFWGIFGNKGETCNAGSRVLVQDSVYDEFVGRLAERAKKLRVGDPLDPSTEMGAQVSQKQLDTILGYVESGRQQGARLLAGGERDTESAKAKGCFMKPTVFGDVKPDMKIAQEEIFGPVLACMRYKDDAQALELANGTLYGLAASLWTRDVAKAHALARKVKSGVVWINCFNEFDDAAPFGGYKESGWGRDLSHHALEGYLQTKAVWTKLPTDT